MSADPMLAFVSEYREAYAKLAADKGPITDEELDSFQDRFNSGLPEISTLAGASAALRLAVEDEDAIIDTFVLGLAKASLEFLERSNAREGKQIYAEDPASFTSWSLDQVDARIRVLSADVADIKDQIAAHDMAVQSKAVKRDIHWLNRARKARRMKAAELADLTAHRRKVAPVKLDLRDHILDVIRRDYTEDGWALVVEEARALHFGAATAREVAV